MDVTQLELAAWNPQNVEFYTIFFFLKFSSVTLSTIIRLTNQLVLLYSVITNENRI